MVSVEPILIVYIFVFFIALRKRRRLFVLFLISIPFYKIHLITTISHPFNPPEVALILLGICVLSSAIRDTLRLKNSLPILLLWLYFAIAGLSILYFTLQPAEIFVHPYGTRYPDKILVYPTVSTRNISQLFLRFFFVVAVTILSIQLDIRKIRYGIRYTVFGAVFVTIVGIIYQVLALLGYNEFIGLIRGLGFVGFRPSPSFTGPIPRMFTTAGEPGFGAAYMVYGFAIVLSLIIIPGNSKVFTRRAKRYCFFLLSIGIILSTSGTAYGGLVVLLGVISAVFIFQPQLFYENSNRVVLSSVIILITTVLAILISPTFANLLSEQFNKLLFQSGSGTIRLYYMKLSADIIVDRPFLGIGVGNHRAPSYLFTLLAESGLLSGIAIVSAHVIIFKQCFAAYSQRNEKRYAKLSLALCISGVTLFVTSLLAKSISTLLMPWYWVSLSFPIALIGYYRMDTEPVSND